MYIFTTFTVVKTINEILVLAFDLQVFLLLAYIFLVETRSIASKCESENSVAARILRAAPRRLGGRMRPAGCLPMLQTMVWGEKR